MQDSGQRLVSERLARGKSQRETIADLRIYAPFPLPDDESLLRSWKRWETGAGVSEEYQRAIADMYGTVPGAIFAKSTQRAPRRTPLVMDDDTFDLVQRLRVSSVDNTALESLHITVERLCSEYAYRPAAELRTEARTWLSRLDRLQEGRLTVGQHTEVIALAGWLALLVGCLENDLGKSYDAEATRRGAILLGQEIGHSEIVGWGLEIKAWMSLTQGDYGSVIRAAQQGQQIAKRHSVAVQLAAQEAKAWARIGDRGKTEIALDRGRQLLGSLDYPDNPRNHFQVDPNKYDFYAMDCYRQSGDNALALNAADNVLRASTSVEGHIHSPMRVAEARLTQASIAARLGDLEQAVAIGTAALDVKRRSTPSLAMVGVELKRELVRRYPDEKLTSEYVEKLSSIRP